MEFDKSELAAGLFPACAMKNAQCTFNFGENGFKFEPPAGYAKFCSCSTANAVENKASVMKGGEDIGKAGNGPLAIVLEPTRDLAEQTYNAFVALAADLKSPPIKSALLVGGVSPKETIEKLKKSEVDVLVGSCVIIHDFLRQKKINPGRCKFFVLDEADQLCEKDNMDKVRGIYNAIPSKTNDMQGE